MADEFDQIDERREQQVQQALQDIENVLLERRRQRQFVLKKTNQFVTELFNALQAVVLECRERGLTELGEPRLIEHPAGGGRQALYLPIEDWNVTFVPLVGTARPNIRDEAQIPGMLFKQIAGRIVVFIGSEQDSTAFYDFLVLPTGAWFAWGYGWPRQASTVEETDFKMLAYGLLSSFIKDIFTTWRTREATTLSAAMDARRRAYVFGLPGDDV
jgi:hypothetical protein